MRTDTIHPAATAGQLTTSEKAKIAKAAQDFEAVFMRQLVSSMRKAGEALGSGEMGEAEKMSMDMAWDGLASQMAKAGGIGIAKMVEPWLAGNPELLRTLPRETPRLDGVASPFGVSADTATRAYRGASRQDISLDALVDKASAATGVDSSLIRGVIQAESAGNPRAQSPKGAIGLMQLMPSTAAELGVDPRDPAQNVMGGARYLASLLRRYDGDEKLALAGYNAGPGAVDRHGGVPPYKETRNYVTSVLAHRKRYAEGEP